MKKLYTILFLAFGLGTTVLAQETSIPVTAVSFPKEVNDVNAGKIDFYAMLTGFSGEISFTCPSSKTVNTDAGACTVVVTGIDPVLTAGGSLSDVRYALSGATTGSGTGSASGLTFNKGITTLTYTLASDATKTCSSLVTVRDAEAPVLASISVTPSILWPPNHTMIPVTVNYTLIDNCGATASLSVSSNEPPTGLNVQVLDKHHLLLRAERNGDRTPRIYVITIAALDASGNRTVCTITVTVPHDMSGITKGKGPNNDIEVTAIPNYSQGSFTLLLQSQSNIPVNMRVLNIYGSVVEARSNIAANRSLQIGSNYIAGDYFAEITQGNRRVVVKLTKINR